MCQVGWGMAYRVRVYTYSKWWAFNFLDQKLHLLGQILFNQWLMQLNFILDILWTIISLISRVLDAFFFMNEANMGSITMTLRTQVQVVFRFA